MNERIKELMIKSGAFDHYEINEGVEGDELPMVKFAELIVRECVLISRTSTDGFTAGRRMEEHFGVKE